MHAQHALRRRSALFHRPFLCQYEILYVISNTHLITCKSISKRTSSELIGRLASPPPWLCGRSCCRALSPDCGDRRGSPPCVKAEYGRSFLVSWFTCFASMLAIDEAKMPRFAASHASAVRWQYRRTWIRKRHRTYAFSLHFHA
jgi:hypothetical protein